METKEMLFHCEDCGDMKRRGMEEAENARCCGKPVNLDPLPQCTSAPNMEMARNDFFDDACNDNRGQVY